jgi:hypothetical protein
MMTIAILPAIRAYSMAVVPDSLAKKRKISLLIKLSRIQRAHYGCEHTATLLKTSSGL